MADHLASIYGTEKDKVNCPFYYKIGACRHGDRCSRVHNKPLFSQTILLQNMYVSPDQILTAAATQGLPAPNISGEDLRHHFDDFYFDMYEEMVKYGTVENIYVCENLADHLAGNTYVKFRDERSAQLALEAMTDRWYAGRLVQAEFSPVTDFREGKCRPFERNGRCERGDFCHFMHLRRQPHLISPDQSAMPETADWYNEDKSGRYSSTGHGLGRDQDYRNVFRNNSRDYLNNRSYDGNPFQHEIDRRYDQDRRWGRERRASFTGERGSGIDGDRIRERHYRQSHLYPTP